MRTRSCVCVCARARVLFIFAFIMNLDKPPVSTHKSECVIQLNARIFRRLTLFHSLKHFRVILLTDKWLEYEPLRKLNEVTGAEERAKMPFKVNTATEMCLIFGLAAFPVPRI